MHPALLDAATHTAAALAHADDTGDSNWICKAALAEMLCINLTDRMLQLMAQHNQVRSIQFSLLCCKRAHHRQGHLQLAHASTWKTIDRTLAGVTRIPGKLEAISVSRPLPCEPCWGRGSLEDRLPDDTVKTGFGLAAAQGAVPVLLSGFHAKVHAVIPWSCLSGGTRRPVLT